MSRSLAPWVVLASALLAWPGPWSLAEPAAVVEIQGYQFRPPDLTVKAGEVVRWDNVEKRQYHSVWFEELGEPEPDYFFPDESHQRMFDKPGVYRYRCGPHPEMRGTITVIE